ncbi:MAG: outer membrane protein assembly factor BamD [Deltaproteobacteria bacterium]|nr:outer membrane protein assembly factor BamD [Deltaproteobacteria bacterium]
MFARLVLVLLLAVAVPTAAWAGVEPEDPEELYEQGLRQMKRGYYDEAVISFEKVRNHFPFNKYSVLSELRVADCLFEKASYLEAVDSYRQFTRLHPRHPEVDYAVYRTARAEFKLAPTVPQRDQQHTTLGIRFVNDFEQRFPESEYLDEVKRLRFKAERRLGRAATQIGNFYWKQKSFGAAERRYRIALDDYPEAPTMGKAAYRRALCLVKLERVPEASEALTALVAVDAEGRWGKRAAAMLEKVAAMPAPEPKPVEAPAVSATEEAPPEGG